ncbi:hypothetical protein UFOVP1604_27 [uncultured Caudovirales phage]|uniref:Uncharacterized protein n=1 Tax=uncultured Caudovirales phage TaxID=2100421 RepID=A0A6J5SV88_9CAUD|nr:hypothetical protein UFOVP1604_27 [uncultured Caudovirales phage]
MPGINPTFGLELMTAEAFAGVNYLETLSDSAKLNKPGFDALTKALTPAAESSGFLQTNVSSIFNKFSVFQYSALNSGSTYHPEGHFIGFSSNLKSDTDYVAGTIFDMVKKKTVLKNIQNGEISNTRRKQQITAALAKYEEGKGADSAKARAFKSNIENTLSNPTAPVLIKWGATKSSASPVGFQPYSLTDFMFCKDYGKIPNNRLITLRRYPFPIDDSLRLGQTDRKRNALPVAQAVTWFGSDTGNSLSNIGVFKWDMTWTEVEVSEQIITGNEVTLNDLLGLLEGATGGTAGKALSQTLKTAYATINGTDEGIQQISGFDEKMQKYQKSLYDSTSGPYWNRIYGPVNAVHKSSRRSRGMQNQNWNTPFTINFKYSFRSFNGMSPKIVALDLISNFINLTYNDAQFLGQLARYFPKTGLKLSPPVTEAFGKILTSWGTSYTGNNSDQFSTILSSMSSALEQAGSAIQNNLLSTIGKGLQTGLMAPDKLGKAIPELISIKSALSDRPVGEWHIVVGNPLNPIFVMGDLLCTNVEMKWDEELGPDDFPTGVSFGVTLKQGKPRDKTAIERMLNLGETKLTSGMLRTSSAYDTFGEDNNKLWNEVAASPDGKQNASLEEYYASLKEVDGGKAQDRFKLFRNRFLTGYGVYNNSELKDVTTGSVNKGSLDDSLLLFYYQRQYGKN